MIFIKYNFLFSTVTKVIKKYISLSDVGETPFAISTRQEIDFMLNKSVKPIPMK